MVAYSHFQVNVSVDEQTHSFYFMYNCLIIILTFFLFIFLYNQGNTDVLIDESTYKTIYD